ncbi:hypothetical protein BKA65DRAFT_410587, partial [Rhexocercosporidium sp. MPI-PUGE-AT-0058]
SLSYRWKEKPSMKLINNTMNALKNRIPLSDFDATIRDAVVIIKALGISYIWIDAFYILQDNNE